MRIYLKYDCYRNAEYGEEAYSSWSASNDCKEEYFTKSEIDTDIDFKIDFEPINGFVYLVKGIYTTGDSFGSETGKVEYVDVFQTIEEAMDFKEKIELMDVLDNETWYGLKPKEKQAKIESIKYKLGDSLIEEKSFGMIHRSLKFKGKRYHFPWGGYFEILENVEVVPLPVH